MKNLLHFREFVDEIKSWPDEESLTYVDTSIEERIPEFLGFPTHYRYLAIVSVKGSGERKISYNGYKGFEGPEEEVVRHSARMKAMELALECAVQIGSSGRVKINDLTLEQANQQFLVMNGELERLKTKYANAVYR